MEAMTTTVPAEGVYFFRRPPGVVYPRRFVWHPDVHRLYDERCYFYFVSAPDPSPDLSLSAQVAEVMTAAEIDSFSLYELFGTFDLLMRIWATGAAALRVTTAIEALASDDFLLLEVSGISYTFADGPRPSHEQVSAHREAIKEISERERGPGWPVADDLPSQVAEIVLSNLAVEVPSLTSIDTDSEPGVKVYIILERRNALRSHAQLDLELKALEAAIAGEETFSSTIYALRNDRGYILKTVVPTFDQIRSSLTPVYSFAIEFGFRSQTFPIASVLDSREADLVDAATRDDSWQAEQVVTRFQAVVPAARTYLGALSPANRDRFVRFLQQSPSPFESPSLINDLANLLEGIATGDMRSTKRGLSFVLEVEDDLRVFLTRVMGEVWGPDWRARYATVALEQGEASPLPSLSGGGEGGPFDDWTFQEFRIATGLLSARDPAVQAPVIATLGQDFRKTLERVRDLRNEVAHRFVGAIDRDGNELARYLLAAETFLRLELFVGKLDG